MATLGEMVKGAGFLARLTGPLRRRRERKRRIEAGAARLTAEANELGVTVSEYLALRDKQREVQRTGQSQHSSSPTRFRTADLRNIRCEECHTEKPFTAFPDDVPVCEDCGRRPGGSVWTFPGGLAGHGKRSR